MLDALRTELATLETAMRPLEPDAEGREQLARQVIAHGEQFLSGLAEGPAFRPWTGTDAFGFPESGRDAEAVLAHLDEHVDQPGITTASPRFLGYIPGGGLYHAALGGYLAAIANKYSGFASAAPGAVRIENEVSAWLAQTVGFPATAGGVLTSGGSIANLTAIVAARDARDPEGGGAIYSAPTAHHCVDKALHIAGRGHAPRRAIAVDNRHRMLTAALAQALEADHADGVRPWLVVASAGTVDTGSIDPLPEIAELCQSYGAWLHVDGAYGGLFALCDEGRAKLAGIERADSLALDPHKTLFLPYGAGAALVHDGGRLLASFSASADYIRPLGEFDVGPSPSDLGPELTRHFRALRLWLPLQLAGVAAFRAAQTEKLKLARYFHARLLELEGFDAGPEPDLSVVAFRFLPGGGDADEFNLRLLKRLQDDGRIFFSGTRLNGHPHFRAAILSFRTHLKHIDEAIDVLARAAGALAAE